MDYFCIVYSFATRQISLQVISPMLRSVTDLISTCLKKEWGTWNEFGVFTSLFSPGISYSFCSCGQKYQPIQTVKKGNFADTIRETFGFGAILRREMHREWQILYFIFCCVWLQLLLWVISIVLTLQNPNLFSLSLQKESIGRIFVSQLLNTLMLK